MPRCSDLRHARGFTLLEVLLASSIAFVVLLGAGMLYVIAQRSFRTGAKKVVAQQESTLLAGYLSRQVRAGSRFVIYDPEDEGVPLDVGIGLAVYDGHDSLLARLEFDPDRESLDDPAGPVSAAVIQDLVFERDPALPRELRFRFTVEDGAGNLVQVEAAAAPRN